MRDAYEEELRLRALRTVILDEAQHLIESGDGKQIKEQLNWIKSMTTETGVLYIKYNLNARRRLMTPTSDSCGRIKKAELFIASVHEELSHGRDSLGVLPAGGAT